MLVAVHICVGGKQFSILIFWFRKKSAEYAAWEDAAKVAVRRTLMRRLSSQW